LGKEGTAPLSLENGTNMEVCGQLPALNRRLIGSHTHFGCFEEEKNL